MFQRFVYQQKDVLLFADEEKNLGYWKMKKKYIENFKRNEVGI